jgi:hypothetical protein
MKSRNKSKENTRESKGRLNSMMMMMIIIIIINESVDG